MQYNDIILEIAKYMSTKDVLSLFTSCKQFMNIQTHLGNYYTYRRDLRNKATYWNLLDSQPVYYPGEDYSIFDCDMDDLDADTLEVTTEIIKTYCPQVKRGDVIVYHGVNVLIYDGNQFNPLDYDDLDDYDYEVGVPMSYPTPEEFPINYWNGITHIPFNPLPYMDQLVNNLNDEETFFEYNYVVYQVKIDSLSYLDINEVDLVTLFTQGFYYNTGEENIIMMEIRFE